MREDRPPSMGSPDAALPRQGPNQSLFQWPLRYPKGRKKSTSLCPVITGKTGPSASRTHYFYTLRDPSVVLPDSLRAAVAAKRAECGRHRLPNAPATVFPGPASVCRSHFASAGTCRILWVKGVAKSTRYEPVAHNTPSFFPGGAADRTILGGSLSPSIFARMRSPALRPPKRARRPVRRAGS